MIKPIEVKLGFGNPDVQGYSVILDYYGGIQINSDRTSSVPLAQYWKDVFPLLTLRKMSMYTRCGPLCRMLRMFVGYYFEMNRTLQWYWRTFRLLGTGG